MNHRGPLSRLVAVTLIVAVAFVFVPSASAQDRAGLSGMVLSNDGSQPLSGAVVHAGDLRTGEIVSSTATAADGSFSFGALPAAVYEIAVQTDGGLYLAGAPVPLDRGEQRIVQVAINPQAAPDPASVNSPPKKGIWNNPLTAALLIIGGAVVVGALVSAADNDNEGVASPFN